MIYDLLAMVYDEINKDISYKDWADFIESIVRKEGRGETRLALDLGCGTGRMTMELSSRGYDMIGIDNSLEMLNVAKGAASDKGLDDKILWLCQDMCDFELYGTVELAISCLDCINHITEIEELKRCFSLVHNYLSPEGLFIFDINGRYKFENIYADNTYTMETSFGVCIWENFYDKDEQLCDFYITLFNETENGLYERLDDEQCERMYTLDTIKNELVNAGFEFIGAYSDFDFCSATDNDERIYIAARCKKV